MRRRTLWAALATVLLLVGAELLFRLAGGLFVPDAYERLVQWCAGPHLPPAARFVSHPDYFYAYDPAEPGINSLGFRGAAPAREGPKRPPTAIVCGDSTVAGEHSWAAVLPRHHDAPLVAAQAAVPGWSLREATLAVENLVPTYRPEVVVIHAGANDLGAAMAAGFKPDYSHWRQPVFGENRRVYQVLKRRRQLFAVSRLGAWLARRSGQTTPTPPRLDALANRADARPVQPNYGADFQQAIAAYLKRIIATCHRHNTRVLLTTQPICAAHGAHADPADTVQKGMVMVSDTIRKQAAAADGFVDLAAALDGRCELFTDLIHTNPEGDTAKARLVAAALPSVFGRQ